MLEIEFEPEKLIGNIKRLQEVQIPRATEVALNQAVYAASQELKSQAKTTFKITVPFTVNSFLYKKSQKTGQFVEAKVFIRDDAPGGNPPSKYLAPQLTGRSMSGGKHYMTRFQGALLNTVVSNAYGNQVQVAERGKMFVPNLRSPKTRVNAYGRMSQGQYTQILSALRGGVSSADLYGTRRKTEPSENKQTNAQYIYLDEESIRVPYFASRLTNSPKPGIYFVNRLQKGTFYYRVMTESRIRTYNGKFNFIDIAEKTATTKFNEIFSSMILR